MMKKVIIFILVIAALLVMSSLFLYRSCQPALDTPDIMNNEEIQNQPVTKTRPPAKVLRDTVTGQTVLVIVEDTAPEENVEKAIEEQKEEKNHNQEAPGDNKELTTIYIPLTKSLFNTDNLSVVHISKGKVYYSGVNGRLESQIIVNGDQEFERLTSYNPQGNKVEDLIIGLVDENGIKRKYASFSQNRISLIEITTGKEEETVTRYLITPELRFVKGKTYKKVL
jgi:hypothetical protein